MGFSHRPDCRLCRWPGYARVDHALVSGQRLETWYDPMLGKIIVHGTDRESARLTLLDALDDSGILGLRRIWDSFAHSRAPMRSETWQ